MGRLILGTAIGIVIGGLVIPRAQEFRSPAPVHVWFNGAQLMAAPRPVRTGYAAGAEDMLEEVIDRILTFTPELVSSRSITPLNRAHNCLEKRSFGPVDQFVDFAESIWRGRAFNAAGLLVEHACD